jgi:hypothetical protein
MYLGRVSIKKALITAMRAAGTILTKSGSEKESRKELPDGKKIP